MTRTKSDDYLRLTGTLLDRVRRAWHGHVVKRFPAVDHVAHRSYGEWLRWSFAVRSTADLESASVATSSGFA